VLVFTNPSSLGPDFLLVGIKGSKGLDPEVAEKNLKFTQKSENISMPNSRIFYNLIISEDLKRLFGEGQVNTDYRPWLEFSAPKLMHTNDLSISKNLISGRWLSEKTISIISDNLKDVDRQIDFAEYTLRIHRPDKPFQNQVDMSMATEVQKERYYKIMEEYCTENTVTDFSLFGDEELKHRCVSVQMKAITEKLKDSKDKASLYLHKGVLYAEDGMADKALESFSDTLSIEPDNAHAYYNLGLILESQDRTAEAVNNYSNALNLNPHYGDALNNLAWILATTDYPHLRDGARAVELAEYACELNDNKDAFMLDTLAAAYAESGQFDKAVQTAQEAKSLALATGNNSFAVDVEKRMQLYRSGRPFRKG
jgi:spermidine synthase